MIAPEGAMCLRWRQIIQFAFFFFLQHILINHILWDRQCAKCHNYRDKQDTPVS